MAALGLERGERVIDVGCGTGNAALVAARAGASAVGVDLAQRLLDVARTRARDEGLEAQFEVGDAVALPAPDGAFDAAVSVFGVIFAPIEAAARELVRVVGSGGRVVVTTWTMDGPTPKVMEVVGNALGRPSSPPTWSDPAVLEAAFAPHEVTLTVEALEFTAPSAEAYMAEHLDHHPMWLASRPALEERGVLDEVVASATSIFEESNEDPGAFRTTSRYHVASVRVG